MTESPAQDLADLEEWSTMWAERLTRNQFGLHLARTVGDTLSREKLKALGVRSGPIKDANLAQFGAFQTCALEEIRRRKLNI